MDHIIYPSIHTYTDTHTHTSIESQKKSTLVSLNRLIKIILTKEARQQTTFYLNNKICIKKKTTKKTNAL